MDCTSDSFTSYDGLVISGSEASVTDIDKIPWVKKLEDLVKDIHKLKEGRPQTVGLCFGHQIIAHALGGKVVRNEKGLEMGNHTISVSSDGKEYLNSLGDDGGGGEGAWRIVGDLNVHFVHNDMVVDVPPSFSNIGSTDLCEVQGLYNKDDILTFQGYYTFVCV